MGITLAGLKEVGYIPEEKERLKISIRSVEIYFFGNFNFLVDILFGREYLLSLSKDIMGITSSLYVDVIKKECKFSS